MRDLRRGITGELGVLTRMLADHVAASDRERADVARIQALVASGDPWNRTMPLHVTASALIVDRVSGRVLLRWHARQQSWLQVGGHADPGEHDPLHVARREGREETALNDLTPWPGRDDPIHVVVVPVPPSAREPAHEHADIRFVLVTEHAERARPEKEHALVRWLTFDDAIALTDTENVRETLRRVREVIGT